MRKAIVTGANGFIGKSLCKMLSKNGICVYAVVRNKGFFDDFSNCSSIIPIMCDMNDIFCLHELIQESVDVFYHLAWAGVSGNARGDYTIQIKNIEWVMNAVESAHMLGCNRFIGIGSTAETDVYNYSTKDEAVPNLVSMYGVAKISSRLMSKALCNSFEMDHLWATLANTYGEGDSSTNFINYAYNQLLSNEPAKFTSGEQLYDFLYIDDIVNGLICIGKNGRNNCNYFIGSGSPQKLKEFIIQMRDVVNPNKELLFGAVPYNGVSATMEQFDITKLVADTGYMPQIAFKEGMTRLNAARRKNMQQEP